MIECDICKDWFHGSCVQVEEHHAVDIDVYHCPNCDVVHGPSLMKKRNNWHRHDYTEPDDGSKPVQAGTPVFIKELQNRIFASGEEILIRMKGEQVTPRYLERHGFNYPIGVTEMEALGLKLPAPTFSVKDVEQYVGGDKVIDVIDVARQADSKMKLSEFIKYFTKSHRPKVLNLISLEFSDTKMSELVEVPDVAQKMSWVENYWPDDSFFPKPFVQKYCLMGVKDSYTDFHIDFGGTSVWYHVLWGEKIFYLIKPTPANLALYEAWSSSPNQSEVFFGEKVEKCYKCVVPQGTTLLIPTGLDITKRCIFMGISVLVWLLILQTFHCFVLFFFSFFSELREDSCPPPTYLVEGVKALIGALKTWLKREVTEPTSEVPDNIRPNHLMKELTKEIRYVEEEPVSGSKPVKSQGSGCGVASGSNGCAARRARRAARRLREQQRHAPKVPSNLDILEQHTREVLKRLEVGPLEEDPAFCAKVHGKLNKVSTASAAAAAESLEDNHLRLMLVNGRIIRDRPTSPSTEEAIQGMLSMAGLLCSPKPEKVASSQEPWWSSPNQCSRLEHREAPQHQRRLQGDKSPMDSQGNSSSEAWDNQGLPSPEMDYQYCDPSMSPPLHPSKRHAPNPPPISNQATKGKRPKKGMATAKQRLGKILKLNRHSRVFV
uniref:JmjC domain-containing protein n=1 Tax=Echeneis naucrates TaxID=173247 RepID=A0A665VP65_ECHNA